MPGDDCAQMVLKRISSREKRFLTPLLTSQGGHEHADCTRDPQVAVRCTPGSAALLFRLQFQGGQTGGSSSAVVFTAATPTLSLAGNSMAPERISIQSFPSPSSL